MRFLFHQHRLEPPLKQMANAMVPVVIGLRVEAIELAHALRQVRLGGLNQHM